MPLLDENFLVFMEVADRFFATPCIIKSEFKLIKITIKIVKKVRFLMVEFFVFI